MCAEARDIFMKDTDAINLIGYEVGDLNPGMLIVFMEGLTWYRAEIRIVGVCDVSVDLWASSEDGGVTWVWLDEAKWLNLRESQWVFHVPEKPDSKPYYCGRIPYDAG